MANTVYTSNAAGMAGTSHQEGPRRTVASWFKASFSDNGATCVEVALFEGGVALRDSKNTHSPVLFFTDQEWEAFLAGVHAGEFELS